jgi:hypothetical protein
LKKQVGVMLYFSDVYKIIFSQYGRSIKNLVYEIANGARTAVEKTDTINLFSIVMN